MDTLEAAFEYNHALVFGIGGSGDIVGAVPTARLLESHGVATTLGGIAWEPAPRDPRIGPRSLEEIDNVAAVSETFGLATEATRTPNGVAFAESHVAGMLDEPTALLDISRGVDALIEGVEQACEFLGIDLVVGTDSGGDVLARGTESGLRSPLTDGIGLVALSELDRASLLGVFGYGSDGELTTGEVNTGIARAAARDGLLGAWGITPRIRREMERLVEMVETEASRLPVEAARGGIGTRTIRGGDVTVELTSPSIVTFYLDPPVVVETSEIAAVVANHRGLEASRDALIDLGLDTEFEREAARMETNE